MHKKSGFGGGWKAEMMHSIRRFEQIYNEQGLYYALAFLYDAQYGRAEIGQMLKLIENNEGYAFNDICPYSQNLDPLKK